MASREPDYRHIYTIQDKLNEHGTIPTIYQTTLEDRLVIACRPLGRLQRRTVARPQKEIKLLSKQRHATRVYLNILDMDPHVFLPFIIAVSPKACESFNLSDFHQRHSKRDRLRLHLKNETRLVLEGMAQREEIISQSTHFKRLIELLFQPSFHTPKPITGAESDKHWRYDAADLNGIRIVFGGHISDRMESAPIRIGEKAKSQTIKTTECVRTRFPHQIQDAIIWLDTGPAGEIAGILFPSVIQLAIFPPDDGYQTAPDPAIGK